MNEDITPRQPNRDDRLEALFAIVVEIKNSLEALEGRMGALEGRMGTLEGRILETRPMKERLDQIYAEVSATRAELTEFRHDFRLLDRRQSRDHDKQIDLEERMERLEDRVVRLEGERPPQ